MLKKIIANQFKKPQGLLGHYAANFMKKNNQEYYTRMVELMDIRDEDTILEIGCGAGYAIKKIADRNGKCTVDGIDFSGFMVKKALKENRNHINAGRVTVRLGDVLTDAIDKKYSKIFAINVIYFWNDLPSAIHKVRQLLTDNGALYFYMSGPGRLKNVPFADDTVFNKYGIDFVTSTLSQSGFGSVTYQTVMKNNFETYYITARNGA